MNHHCNGDYLYYNGAIYYRCLGDGTITPLPNKSEIRVRLVTCPHCTRDIRATNLPQTAQAVQVRIVSRVEFRFDDNDIWLPWNGGDGPTST